MKHGIESSNKRNHMNLLKGGITVSLIAILVILACFSYSEKPRSIGLPIWDIEGTQCISDVEAASLISFSLSLPRNIPDSLSSKTIIVSDSIYSSQEVAWIIFGPKEYTQPINGWDVLQDGSVILIESHFTAGDAKVFIDNLFDSAKEDGGSPMKVTINGAPGVMGSSDLGIGERKELIWITGGILMELISFNINLSGLLEMAISCG
jgi:hypothetical protein